jgi:CRISPR type I-D-associated protein Csc2
LTHENLLHCLIDNAVKHGWHLKYGKHKANMQQPLLAHAINVASTACRLANIIPLSDNQIKRLMVAGFLHDCKKSSEEFQLNWIRKAHTSETILQVDKGAVEYFLSFINKVNDDKSLFHESKLSVKELESALISFIWANKTEGLAHIAESRNSSPQFGDEDILSDLVTLADAICSLEDASDCVKLSRHHRNQYFSFDYHEFTPIRGVLTQFLSKAVEESYKERGYVPIMWFTNSTLYATGKNASGQSPIDKDAIRRKLINVLFDFFKNIPSKQLVRSCYGGINKTVISIPEFLFIPKDIFEDKETIITTFWKFVANKDLNPQNLLTKYKEDNPTLTKFMKALKEEGLDDSKGNAINLMAEFNTLIILKGVLEAAQQIMINAGSEDNNILESIFQKSLDDHFVKELGSDKSFINYSSKFSNNTEVGTRIKILRSLRAQHEIDKSKVSIDEWRKRLVTASIKVSSSIANKLNDLELDRDPFIKLREMLCSDLVYPEFYSANLKAENIYNIFSRGKTSTGTIVCVVCGNEPKFAALADLIGKSDIYHDMMVAGSRLNKENKLRTCGLCNFESKFRKLMMDTGTAKVIVIFPYGREYASKYDIKLTDELQNCELKDELCRKCPRCVLFGSMITESSSSKPKRKRWSIKHRIEYSSAFSLEAYDSISERITFNALVDSTQSTGRALGTVENIIPLANFPTVITLSSITEEEFIFLLKVLLASKSYGAEGRLKGDCENYIVGICAGLEEIITSLEYNLELAAMSDDNLSNIVNVTEQILNDYLKKSAFKTNNLVLASNDLQSLVDSVSTYEPNKEFVQALYNNANKFAEEVDKRA